MEPKRESPGVGGSTRGAQNAQLGGGSNEEVTPTIYGEQRINGLDASGSGCGTPVQEVLSGCPAKCRLCGRLLSETRHGRRRERLFCSKEHWKLFGPIATHRAAMAVAAGVWNFEELTAGVGSLHASVTNAGNLIENTKPQQLELPLWHEGALLPESKKDGDE